MGRSLIVTRLGYLYIVGMTVWVVERLLFFDRWWPFALLNTLASFLFLPLPIFLVWALWRRERPLLVSLLLPTAVFAALFGKLFLPSLPDARAVQSTVTVMTFNVLFKNEAYDAMTNSIQTAVPDVVGLQELTDEIAAELLDSLQEKYPYHTLDTGELDSGVGLLSRYPLEQVEQLPPPMPLDRAIEAVVIIEGQRVHLFVVHLTPNQVFSHPLAEFAPLIKERYGRRASEVAWLKAKIDAIEEPVLLLCDCNLTDTAQVHAQFSTFLKDSFQEAGWGFGHTFQPPVVSVPIQRIDYIWHSDEFIALEAFVGLDGGSDHLPTVAKLGFVMPP